MEKENVDNLFRDTLDDFAQAPNPKVWDRIQASLDKKARKKRRVVPLWWQLGGVAAALALILFLSLPGAESDLAVPANEQVTSTSAAEETTDSANDVLELPIENKEALVETSDTAEQNQENVPGITPSSSTGLASKPSSNSENVIQSTVSNQGVALNEVQNNEPAVTQNPSVTELLDEEQTVVTSPISDEIGKSEDVAKAQTLPSVAEVEDVDSPKEFRDLFEEVAEEENPEQSDSGAKWAVGPSVAPVLYNANGTGSPIDNAFINNEKSGNVNMSYGVKVTYKLSDKWQLRSGLHKVDYTYDTNDIVFSSSLSATANSGMRNIDFAPTSDYLVVESNSFSAIKAGATGSDEIAAKNPARTGTMVQEMGYLEIPMEINYVLVDKKVGINVVSGVSSLFLLDNVVNLESDNGTTEMGTANNINSVNFSANFGLGIDYDITEKFKIQLEPLIKYQLNTFQNTAGEFNPYSIGIYSGIQYKF